MERAGREIPKDYRDVVNHQIDHHGWRYDPSGKGYPQLYPANPEQPQLSVPKTPSSQRTLRVFIRKVRQRDGTWPPEKEG